MTNILSRSLVDTDVNGDILCLHKGKGHRLSSISITGMGKRFLWADPKTGNTDIPIICKSSEKTSQQGESIAIRLDLRQGMLRNLVEALENDRIIGKTINAAVKRKELKISRTLAQLRGDIKALKINENDKETLLSLLR